MRLVGDYTVSMTVVDGVPYLTAHRNGPIPAEWLGQPGFENPMMERAVVVDSNVKQPVGMPKGWDKVKALECVVAAYDDKQKTAKQYGIDIVTVEWLLSEFEAGKFD